MRAKLVLEDGTIFEGQAFGATGHSSGEVVFNTSMTGYQEILTDPSYCGQIITMTYPLIGNYGINDQDFEAKQSFDKGFIVKENCTTPSNWRSRRKLEQFLEDQGVIGLAGIDTRALTKKLRNYGTMGGYLTTDDVPRDELLQLAKKAPIVEGSELVPMVTPKTNYHIPGAGHRVVLMDFGAKDNIARCLNKHKCDVIGVPATTSAKEIMALNPSGIMLSNGPGDPKDVPYVVETVRQLMDKVPIFGICLGHQILGLALGGETYKLKFGHRGANHPVKDFITGRVYITSQNHGYAIEETSLSAADVMVSQRNLHDFTVEGLQHLHLPLFSVQYHPEASPGPWDTENLFHKFIINMEEWGCKNA